MIIIGSIIIAFGIYEGLTNIAKSVDNGLTNIARAINKNNL